MDSEYTVPDHIIDEIINSASSKDSARRARQVLILGPGSFSSPFDAQVKALRQLLSFICQQLKVKCGTKVPFHGIEMERVVFTKVR